MNYTNLPILLMICRYRHVVTGLPQSLPLPRLGGGILADVCPTSNQPTVGTCGSNVNQDMGLGKTLSTLALICHDIDMICDFPSSHASKLSRASLIVTPKSSRCPTPHLGRKSSTSAVYANMVKPYMDGSNRSRGLMFHCYLP
jgi:hypothetical protein